MKRFRSSQVLPNNKFSASESSDGLGLAGLKYVSVPAERSDQSHLQPRSAATNKTEILISYFFSCVKTTCQYSRGINSGVIFAILAYKNDSKYPKRRTSSSINTKQCRMTRSIDVNAETIGEVPHARSSTS